jgi:plastocyanin
MKTTRKCNFFIVLGIILGFASFCDAAAITGSAVYEGPVPKFKTIKMDADPVCLTHNTAPVLPQTLVLGEGQTMGNVFVHIKGGLPKREFPVSEETAVITQKGCMYDPHVLGVMAGQEVKILNPDGTLHNVHALPKINKEFNLAMPKFRKETTKVFDKEEFMFPIKCDVHPWMGAWISVMGHPYFMVTKEDGKFFIDKLPAGTYKVEAWHEKLGPQSIEVALAADETKEIIFTFSRPEKK